MQIKLENYSFCYAGAKKNVLNDVSLCIEQGEIVLICGKTGCGKTSLLRQLKPELLPNGISRGNVLYDEKNYDDYADFAGKIGFVMQRPENQIVNDTIFGELRFGLENMGLDDDEIDRRIAEISLFFGLDEWKTERCDELSGGMKQILNLAAITAMRPQIILLDEPTSQLDPIAAEQFISLLVRLNRETGISIVIAEHRCNNIFPYADKIVLMDEATSGGGFIAFEGTVKNSVQFVMEHPKLQHLLPQTALIFAQNGYKNVLTVADARRCIASKKNLSAAKKSVYKNEYRSPSLEMKNAYFRYEKTGINIINGLNLTVFQGEIYGILGANSAGKSTLLKILAGLAQPYLGKLFYFGKNASKTNDNEKYSHMISYLPQDVSMMFCFDSVKAEIGEKYLSNELFQYDFEPLFDRHPLDLSGGEQQLLGLYKCAVKSPKIMLLDEPTKGLDEQQKQMISALFSSLKKQSVTIIMITHDVEFAATACDKCGFLHRGKICGEATPEVFFSKNAYFTTESARITNGYANNIVTYSQLDDFLKDETETKDEQNA